jgi:hypothetical protein
MVDAPEAKLINTREQLLGLWEHYSAGLPSTSLELRVAQRALRDGCSAKEVTLMLVAGSETVRQLYKTTGRPQAMKFASHIVRIANSSKAPQNNRALDQRSQCQMTIGD